MENKKYVCIEEFEVPILNNDGNTEYIKFEKGSKWEIENDCTIFAGNIKLKNEKSLVELMEEKIDKYFVEMINKTTLFDSYDGPRIIVLPKTIPEDEIMEEAKKCFKKYCDEYLDEDHDYYLDDEYSEIGIKRAMFEGDMTDTVTDIEKETLYKVWQVKIYEYPF